MSPCHSFLTEQISLTRTYKFNALADHPPTLLAAALIDADHGTNAVDDRVRNNPEFSELRRFASEVETLINQLMPTWSGGFPLVEVTTPFAHRAQPDDGPFIYYGPAGAAFLTHEDIDSVQRITLHHRKPSTQFTLQLSHRGKPLLLHAELPLDARRAELGLAYDNTHSGPASTPLIGSLNQRPEAEVALLHALKDSPARIYDPGDGRTWTPAHMAGLRQIDDALRHSGLYDVDVVTHAIVERLAPSWHHKLSELRTTAQALADCTHQLP